ncbi:MAG TPA: hypothetical protein VK772_09665, partial [Puia sp.]|nr:hypothetical protein [Puia sp.]
MSKIFGRSIIVVVSTLFIGYSYSQSKLPQLGKDPVSSVVQAMTLEEKAKFVVGNGFSMPGLKPDAATNIGMTKDKVAGASGTTFAIPRLGIPSMVVSD